MKSLLYWVPLLMLAVNGCGNMPTAEPSAELSGPEPGAIGDGRDDEIRQTVEDFQKASWLVVAASDFSVTTATAFGVGPNLLATNAHVVEGIIRVMGEPNGVAGAFQHESGVQRAITILYAHPDYDADSLIGTPDVGLLETDLAIPNFLTLPDDNRVPHISVFDSVSLCGFPGSTIGIDFIGIFTSGEFHPRVSCHAGTISAIRPFDSGTTTTPENGQLLQYDISTEAGVSGSAVFNDEGQIIGVHALGFSSNSEINAAMRVDTLSQLVGWVSERFVSGTVLDDIPPLDSDGDGFTDDDEINSIPGTDPFDATDNPINVRDTDDDGCSDYDELNFDGFCDNDPATPRPDEDADGVPDDTDNCVTVVNPDQADSDSDSFGDACDLCLGGDDRFDFDADGIPQDCDVCPLTFDPAQIDSDGDGVGDSCELFIDFDGDGIEDSVDNCILFPNPDQADSDVDGVGDACEFGFAPPIAVESVIIADDGQFLGVINDNAFDSDSIANDFGTYGSTFGSFSIWNEFGTYGSAFGPLSPWNDFATNPPLIFEGEFFVAYLTTNSFFVPNIDPNDLAIFVGRPEETRP